MNERVCFRCGSSDHFIRNWPKNHFKLEGVKHEGLGVTDPISGSTSVNSQIPGNHDLLEDITIRRAGVVFTIPIKVENKPIQAVLDTGAEVTIISDKVFPSIKPSPKVIKEVILRPAGRDMVMQGKTVGPVKILIGNTTYEDNIYVAPIEDKMLLGLNFLRRVGASAHLASDILTTGNEQVIYTCIYIRSL